MSRIVQATKREIAKLSKITQVALQGTLDCQELFVIGRKKDVWPGTLPKKTLYHNRDKGSCSVPVFVFASFPK